MKNKAFTLIELLVVISIVTLLIAILFPALRRVRQSAYLVVCGSNQRQIFTGLASYAQDYDEGLPPYTYLGVSNYFTQSHHFYAFRWHDDNWHNLGHLYDQNYLRAGPVFYCPAVPESHFLQFDNYAPWPTSDSENRIRSSYYYNPHTDNGKRRYERLIDLPPGKLMLLDALHSPTPFHELFKGWNITQSDGSVHFIAPAIIDLMLEPGYQWDNWSAFEESLTLLLEY